MTDRYEATGVREPRNLWEAMGRMAQLREQADFAHWTGDTEGLTELRERQGALWGRVEELAANLTARGEAPVGMVERLRVALEVPEERVPGECREERRAA